MKLPQSSLHQVTALNLLVASWFVSEHPRAKRSKIAESVDLGLHVDFRSAERRVGKEC